VRYATPKRTSESRVTSDGERALVGTQGVQTGLRRPGLLFALLKERFRCRGPGVLCFVLARVLRWERRWEGEEGGPVGRGGRGRIRKRC
jgi:hypothetical protein